MERTRPESLTSVKGGLYPTMGDRSEMTMVVNSDMVMTDRESRSLWPKSRRMGSIGFF